MVGAQPSVTSDSVAACPTTITSRVIAPDLAVGVREEWAAIRPRVFGSALATPAAAHAFPLTPALGTASAS